MKFVLLLAAVTIGCVSAQGGADSKSENEIIFEAELMKLVKKHFDLSVKYMFTSSGFGSERVQKPGMAKLLTKLSNSHWDEAMDTLKKHFKRGGNASDVQPYLSFSGRNELDMYPVNLHKEYLDSLRRIHTDAQSCSRLLNKLYRAKNDGDWRHYFEEKLEDVEKQKREMKGYITTIEYMPESSIGIHAFDSHL